MAMNEEIILGMAQPYVKDGAITYDEFENIYSILSLREQYAVIDILFRNGINLVDKQIDEEALILDVEDETEDDFNEDFEVLYDESMFKDKSQSEASFDHLVINKNIRQSNEILCSLIQEGNRQAVQDLCVKNKRLVDKYVLAYENRYGNRLDFEDLEQVGFIGLIKAAHRYSIQTGTAFSTYAVFWIKQSISREIMDNGYAIRIPVHMMERINKVIASDNKFAGQGMALPERIQCMAEELGYSEDIIRECLILKNNYLSYTSLDTPIGEENDSMLGDFIPDEEETSVEKIVADKLLRQELETAMATLTPREQRILKLRFGWDDGKSKTLEEIGTYFNITRERIRQIEAKALRKMRHPSRSKHLKPFLED